MTVFKIKGYNPEKQEESYFQEFELEDTQEVTLLDCMHEIKWTQAGSLT